MGLGAPDSAGSTGTTEYQISVVDADNPYDTDLNRLLPDRIDIGPPVDVDDMETISVLTGKEQPVSIGPPVDAEVVEGLQPQRPGIAPVVLIPVVDADDPHALDRNERGRSIRIGEPVDAYPVPGQ